MKHHRRAYGAFWLLGALGLALTAAAQSRPAAGNSAEPLEPGLVVVYNRPIVVLRAPAFGYSPTTRAGAANDRIAALIAAGIYGPVATESRAEGILVTVGGQLGLALQPGDVDMLAGKTLEETAAEAARNLEAALEQARLQHSVPYLLQAGARAAAATLALILLIVLAVLLRRRVRPHVLAFEQRLTSRIVEHGFFFVAHLVRWIRWLLQAVMWSILAVAASEWLSLCLGWFPYTRPWGEALQGNLLLLVRSFARSMLTALPDLVVIAFIALLARGVAGILKAFFSGVGVGRVGPGGMDAETARATRRILTVVVWLIAVVMIYPYIPGSGSAAFKGISVFVGLLLSFGSSSVVSQFTSGLVLMYSRALRPGEYVRIGEQEGTVESLGFLSTKIRSPKNEEFHVPNAVILGTTIKNYSRLAQQGGLLVHTSVTIGYDVPWRQVHALLMAAARRTKGLGPEPAPFVLQTALSDFYVEYQLNACLQEPKDRLRVLADLHANIQDQFNQDGVPILSPHYYVEQAGQRVLVAREKWHTPPAAPASTGSAQPTAEEQS